MIRSLIDESRAAGRFAIEWDGRDSGMYYRMTARDFVETKEMMLLK